MVVVKFLRDFDDVTWNRRFNFGDIPDHNLEKRTKYTHPHPHTHTTQTKLASDANFEQAVSADGNV